MKQRIISMLLLISTLLSLFISPAYAWDASAGGSSNPGGLTEEEQANVDDKKDRIENAGGSFDPNGWGFWVP